LYGKRIFFHGVLAMPGPNNTSTADNAAAVPVPNPAAAIMGRASDRPNGWGMPVDSRSPIASPAQPQNLNDRHSIFDRGLLHVAHSLEGKQPDYVTDTTTGEVKEVVTPRKPGEVYSETSF
jgi:hypothetical protein